MDAAIASVMKNNQDTEMLIRTFYSGIEVHRDEKIIVVKFLVPHRVISTCRANGGLRDDLDLIYNHQSCEPNGRISDRSIGAPECKIQTCLMAIEPVMYPILACLILVFSLTYSGENV